MNLTSIYRKHHLPHNRENIPIYLYLGATLRTFGYSMLGGFGTIYLYIVFRDFGFTEKEAFVLVLLRVAVLYILKLYLSIPIVKWIKRVGPKTSIVIGPMFSAISMITWALSAKDLAWIVPGVFIGAIMANVYWIPYHSVFSSKSQEEKIGRQIGYLSIIGAILGIITPALSGLIIEKFGGFDVLFAAAFVFFTMSSVVFMMMEMDLKIDDFKWGDFDRAFKKEKRLFPDYVVIGMENLIQDIVWAVFVFLFISSFFKLGLLASGISLALALFTYFIGKLSDEEKVGGIDRYGAFFNGIIWVGKLFVQNGLHVFFVDSLFGLFRTAYSVPLDVIVYSEAKHDNPLWPVIVREFALDIGRIFTAILAAILIFYNFEYWIIFLISAIGYILLGLLLKDN